MRTSVIVSTYNEPTWLEKCLWGFFAQNRRDFEVVIADDGSGPETLDRLRSVARRCPVPLTHVWQPDEGFQKCRILNKAIAVARGERVLLTDGDCIPRADFVDAHDRLARPDIFLSGGRFMLPEETSRAISAADAASQNPFHPRWLHRHGAPWSPQMLKLIVRPPLDGWLDGRTTARRRWNGHNASCTRWHAIQVNGFEEQMQYGGEDLEFGVRLEIAGVSAARIRYSAVTLHLHHRHGYVTADMHERNQQTMQRTLRERRSRAEIGIDQWIRDDGSVRLGTDDRTTVLQR